MNNRLNSFDTTAPDYEQGYLDSFSGYGDSWHYEPKPVIPTYPIKPRFIPTFDGYDILNRASGEWYAIAAECGIDGQKLHGLINRNQTIYKRGIELNKSYKGKVWVYVRFKTAKSGQEHVTITFKTFKHGEVKATFNGWQWLENNGYVGKKDTVARPSTATTAAAKPEQPKYKPVQTIAARACVACKTDFIPPFENSTHCEYCYKLSKFDSTQKHFNRLKPNEGTSRLTFQYRGVLGITATLNKSYLAKKGFTIEDIKASGLDVRQGQDKQ